MFMLLMISSLFPVGKYLWSVEPIICSASLKQSLSFLFCLLTIVIAILLEVADSFHQTRLLISGPVSVLYIRGFL